jgi:hypothetical protein
MAWGWQSDHRGSRHRRPPRASRGRAARRRLPAAVLAGAARCGPPTGSHSLRRASRRSRQHCASASTSDGTAGLRSTGSTSSSSWRSPQATSADAPSRSATRATANASGPQSRTRTYSTFRHNPKATIVGDLSAPGTLPEATFGQHGPDADAAPHLRQVRGRCRCTAR